MCLYGIAVTLTLIVLSEKGHTCICKWSSVYVVYGVCVKLVTFRLLFESHRRQCAGNAEQLANVL